MAEEIIIATYELTIYQNGDFSINLYRNLKTGKTFKATGSNLPCVKKLEYELHGEIVENKYGKQLKVLYCTEHIEKSEDGIKAYLSSGAIKGIGKKTAEKIVAAFGADSLEVIAKDPDRLTTIKGITPRKAANIAVAYSKAHVDPELIKFMSPYGFSTNQILAVSKIFPTNTIDNIKERPYELCKARGISFAQVDKMKRALGVDDYDYYRIYYGMKEALKLSFLLNGNVGVPKETLIKETAKVTGLPNDMRKIWQMIQTYVQDKRLSYRKTMVDDQTILYFYPFGIKEMEDHLAEQIIRLINMPNRDERYVKAFEERLKFNDTLNGEQKQAVINAAKFSLSIITGGPGTGKTTVIKEICDSYRAVYPNKPQVLMAPTGKAARRMTESTRYPASTIHKQLAIRPDLDDEINLAGEIDTEPIERSLVVIDEFSMVGMKLANILFSKLEDCNVVIVGDPDQLQSVEAGNVLGDMIASGVIPIVNLKYVYRQQEGSGISEAANAMQNGKTNLKQTEDFEVIAAKNAASKDLMLQGMEDDMIKEYLRLYHDQNIRSIVCLCPYKKYVCGVESLNKRLQGILNPSCEQKGECKAPDGTILRIGDPVMHIKKNLDEVFNGNTGTIIRIEDEDGDPSVFVEYDLGSQTTVVEYTGADLELLTLCYAMTVHKSQGSEYDAVVTCLSSMHSAMLKRNIPYTAVTRAKKRCSFFTDNFSVLEKAINNNQVDERHTMLAHLLKQKVSPKQEKGEDKKQKELQNIKQIKLSDILEAVS